MKLQFRLMSLALVVFASNVQAVTVFGKTFDKQTFTNSRLGQLASKNPKTSASVVAATAVTVYLFKSGKLDSAIAKTKQAAKNAGSWINGHRKTTAALVVAALGSGYAYKNPNSVKALVHGSRLAFNNAAKNVKSFCNKF